MASGASVMSTVRHLSHRPRQLGIVAAIGATGLGLVTMAAAGAPAAYLAVNGAALVIGLAMLAILLRSRMDDGRHQGVLVIAAAIALGATALLGVTLDGATRWVRVGPVVLQPSLILLPVMILAFGQNPSRLATLGMLTVMMALALQPDRAMAATLLAGVAVLAARQRDRRTGVALAAAIIAFAGTLGRSDTMPAAAFVERVFADGFAFSPLAGIAMVIGAALMLLPALARDVSASLFLAIWSTILVAAVLGNYPTPLLGYGGSGVIGYLLCLVLLPARSVPGALGKRAGRDALHDAPDIDRCIAPIQA